MSRREYKVSLHAEGVDSNVLKISFYWQFVLSPSMRREWIEIHAAAQIPKVNIVSLHAEGVD